MSFLIRLPLAPRGCRHSRPERDRRRHRASTRPAFRLEALEDRRLLSGISGFTEYPVPSSLAGAPGIVLGSDHNLWFLENSADKIGMINPTTHVVSEFPIPTANSNPWGIAAGPDGNIWFTERTGNKVAMIDVNTHAIGEFAVPSGSGAANPIGITAGPDGNVWFAGYGPNGLGMINPATHAITLYMKPSDWGNAAMWITGGPDGNLWFTELGVGRIARFNPTTHAEAEFATPGGLQSRPFHITSGPDGNVWYADSGTDSVVKIDPATGAATAFPVPTANAHVNAITTGPDGDLWFTETAAGQIGRIDPTTGAITEYPAHADVVATGADGNLWFTDQSSNAIGVTAFSSTQLVVTQQPPVSVTAGQGFGLTVVAEDASGNVATSYNGPLTVSLGSSPGGVTLGGTLTATATNGVATFSGLSLTRAASRYTLVTSGGGFAMGFTSAFAVTPAAATQLVITQQTPSSVSVNAQFTLVAAIEDQYGNIVTSANNAVTVALGSNPGGSTLGGATTVTAVNGIVTFSNLTLNRKGRGYTLRLSSSGLTGATTSPFNVA